MIFAMVAIKNKALNRIGGTVKGFFLSFIVAKHPLDLRCPYYQSPSSHLQM
jgi:hypothetical protein